MQANDIKQLIESSINSCTAIIEGDDGTHFQGVIVSEEFVGKSMVQQHQLVYKALGSKMGNEIHALSMQTLTPAEWEDKQNKTLE